MGLRKIFLLALLCTSFFVKAQVLQQPNTYGIGWKRTGADTLLYIPSDTLNVPAWGVGKAHIAKKGTALYYWDGSKWSAITGSGSTYTAGNGLTLSGSQFKLGGTLTENTTINVSDKTLTFNSASSSGLNVDVSEVSLNSNSGSASLQLLDDGVNIGGSVTSVSSYFALPNIPSGSSTDSVLVWTAGTGQVKKRNVSSLVSTPTLQQVLTAGNTTTNDIELTGTNKIIISDNGKIITPDVVGQSKSLYLIAGTGSGANGIGGGITLLSGDGTDYGGDIDLAAGNSDSIPGEAVLSGGNQLGINGVGGRVQIIGGYGSGSGSGGIVIIRGGFSDTTGGNVKIDGGAGTDFIGHVILQSDVESGKVGIGTQTPDSTLHLVGGLKIVNGTQGAGKVLTSDANGGASWQNVTISRIDTITIASFGYGARLAGDTAAATDSSLYGSFYHDGSDTLIITGLRAVITSGDTLGVQVYYNDTINVIGSAVATSTLAVNSSTTGNSTTTFSNNKIPPGNWVWCKSPTVVAGRKPEYLSVSLIGYRKTRQ